MMFLWTSALLSLPLLAPHVLAGHAGQVSDPSAYQRARFRWWWPGGWNDGVLNAYEHAAKLGVHVDMTLGPHWPTGFPGYTPDSPETMKELVHGQVFVQAGETFSGALPLPVAAPSGNQTGNLVNATPKLVALLAAKTTTANESAAVGEFDPETVTVITDSVDNGTLTWTAPSDGAYVVIAAYARGTGQIQNMYDGQPDGPKVYSTPGYIVDHFSEAGMQAGVKYWEEHILTPELTALLRENNGSIFEDSLELKYKQLWTLNFTQEFQARRGYDISPFLLYLLKDTTTFTGDNSTATKITNDFYKTITDLYVDYRLKGVTAWANSLGLKFRVQPYTLNFDSAYIASLLDIPEGESLGFDGAPDSFRVLSTGRDIGGRTTILSNEIGAYFGKAYGVTWKFLLGTANLDSALGVSQNVIHGFAYEDSPSSLWPGFAPFTPLGASSNGFADAWGPRQPQWVFAKAASRYLAFSQKLLQESGASIDVAILNQDWGVTAAWDDSNLNDAGYSYQFPTPYLLQKHGVAVQDGVLAADGPGYRALIINNQTTMDISTAELVLSYGKAGLPVVVSGNSPRTTFSYYTEQNAADEELTSILSEILNLSTTRIVSGPQAVPEALSELGVSSSVEYPEGPGNNSVITYRRTVGDGYLYWIYNNGDEHLQLPVRLAGAGAPYDINLRTGDVKPFAAFNTKNGYVSLNVTLAPEAVATIFVGYSSPFSVQPLSNHLTSTDCRAVVNNGTVQISSNTTCSATTSTNQTITLDATDIPESTTPSTWTLRVQDWSPQYSNATGNASVATSKTWLAPIQLTSPLVPWTNITGLEHASGVGVYNTTVTLDVGSGADLRVLLHMPEVEGSWGLTINGQEVEGVDWFASEPIDVTDYVTFGAKNAIEITVATSLWNKLVSVWPAVYGSEVPVANGLAGSVVLTMEKILVVS
ncbi:secreted protein [Colletotrichum chrysophilum]|uniref:Secreted protein n=1 Tax=Colletotrichum chrysophilum TaxID=1836956 RepID=A0AAD9AGV3_9PEZI|nr:secreted protein [Colletotrichum chrysophilum]